MKLQLATSLDVPREAYELFHRDSGCIGEDILSNQHSFQPTPDCEQIDLSPLDTPARKRNRATRATRKHSR